jgi:hypothetical protein
LLVPRRTVYVPAHGAAVMPLASAAAVCEPSTLDFDVSSCPEIVEVAANAPS